MVLSAHGAPIAVAPYTGRDRQERPVTTGGGSGISGRWFAAGLGAVLLAVAAVYAPTLNDYFGGDDFLVIGPVHATGAWSIIGRAFILRDNIPYWRPLVTPIYSLYVHGFWLHPAPYHAVVLALHLTNVTLLALVAAALAGRRAVALAAALLFGVGAWHTTTVAQISSTVELFSVVWYLTCVLGAVCWATEATPAAANPWRGPASGWYRLSVIAFVLALLSKESTASAAEDLRRHVMALPGPVTSDLSAGCHDLVRDGRAVLVTGCPDVVELIGEFGGDPPADRGTTAVLQALLRCDAAEESELAAGLGCSEAAVSVALASLEGAGFVVRGRRGWTVSDAALARIAGTD